MANSLLEHSPKRPEEKSIRALVRAGCGPEELRQIQSYLLQRFPEEESSANKLAEIAAFARAIGPQAARDFFRAIGTTGAVGPLTEERLLSFARSVDPHTAEWYFWTIWGTKAVSELTHDRVLRAVRFFRSIDSPATVEYFLAIRETKAASELTSEAVLAFAESIGSEAAVEYFGACWETKAVPALTNERVLDFARFLGGDGAKEYFQAIRETKAVDALTDPKLFQSVTALGALVAHDFFRAIRVTRSVSALTDDRVLVFAESIGRGTAAEYFRVVGSTKAVGALTSEKLFQTSGIIRSIGRDAALDYFLATANLKSAPSTGPSETRDPVAGADTAVPVLTLLDIPTYAGYRYAGLLAVSSIFWTYIWQFSGFGIGSVSGPLGIGVLIAAWAVVLVGAYLVSGSIAERSTREFLQRRRRLLNEHGIRWHDCRASDSRCPVCWTTERTHADLKFDYERFCRCTAC